MTNEELKTFIQNCIEKQVKIPKPQGETFITKIGYTSIDRKKQLGFQYTVGADRKKYVTFDTLYKAYEQILESGQFSREWYNKTFPIESSRNPCNFTTIGGIFVQLKIVYYDSTGLYKKVM